MARLAVIGTADVVPTKVFFFNNRLWVPHYLHENTYVAPGGKYLHEDILVRYGALSTVLQLWPRARAKKS